MAVATRSQTVVVRAVVAPDTALDVPTWVHPAGAVSGPAPTPVAISSSPLPALTLLGTVTACEAPLPLALAEATKATVGACVALTVTGWVVLLVSPRALVTVSVTW